MPDVFRSRKFWAYVVGLVVTLLGERAGLDAASLTSAVIVVVGYILGTALEDGLSAR